MIQTIKEIFITFIALYMMVVFSGMFNTVGFLLVKNTNSEAPVCTISKTDKPCTCSCARETARECCCCSVEDDHSTQSTSQYVITKGNCNDLPTLYSNPITFKFVEQIKNNFLLYPSESIYTSVKQLYKQDFNPSIDHPPSVFSS